MIKETFDHETPNKMFFGTFFFGTFFNCKWPAKALQELFTDAKVIPDPEFKSFDLKSLRTKSPGSSSDGRYNGRSIRGAPQEMGDSLAS